jgi:hypothetical protein
MRHELIPCDVIPYDALLQTPERSAMPLFHFTLTTLPECEFPASFNCSASSVRKSLSAFDIFVHAPRYRQPVRLLMAIAGSA